MIRFNTSVSSAILSLTLILFAHPALAQSSKDIVSVDVKDVSEEYIQSFPRINPSPTPASGSADPGGIVPTGDDKPTSSSGTGTIGNAQVGTLNNIIVLGSKVWDFVINNKPTTDYTTLKTSIVPAGITDFSQMNWKRDKIVTKVYRVSFKTITGAIAGGFDYRVNFIYGGTYKGKGQYIGQLSVAPLNVKLHTDRSLTFRAEVLDPLNFGTEQDPIAAVQLLITWSSPTTTRYSMSSAEYMMFGDGEIQELPNVLR